MAIAANGSARFILIALLVASLVLVWLIIRPFAASLFMAAVLAVTFHPWYARLVTPPGGRRTLGASIITTRLVLALVLPLATLGGIAVREAPGSLDFLHKGLAQESAEGLIRPV